MGKKLYITATGGGSRYINEILEAGGASAYLIGAEIPYARNQIDSILGGEPEKYASKDVASRLAGHSFFSARSGVDSLGVGVTACMGCENQRKGRKNFAWVSICHYEGYAGGKVKYNTLKVEFDPEEDRTKQEKQLATFIKYLVDPFIKGKG